MTREEKCLLAIEKGYTYNPETGEVFSRFGRLIKSKSYGYILLIFQKNNKRYNLKCHQFAWYCIYKECVNEIDHINGIRNDNRIINLRSVSHQQNIWNQTKAKGYYWYKRDNKWQSQIKFNGKQICLGRYNTEEEARNAYLQAKEKYHII